MPGLAIFGLQQLKFQLAGLVGNRISENDAMLRIPEGDRVEESLGIVVGELKLPVLSGIGSVIDAGLLAGPGGHQESLVARESHYATKVERGRVRNVRGRPGASAINCAQISAVSAAGPGNLPGDSADSTKALGGMGDLDPRAGLSHRAAGENHNKQKTHDPTSYHRRD
jgi:hypothetical protein